MLLLIQVHKFLSQAIQQHFHDLLYNRGDQGNPKYLIYVEKFLNKLQMPACLPVGVTALGEP
jgi:hypothetical protein